MQVIHTVFQEFLKSQPYVQELPQGVQEELLKQVQAWRYRMGQPITVLKRKPKHVLVLYKGSARSVYPDPRSNKLVTIQRFYKGDVIGWLGVLRGRGCENVIATDESVGIVIPASLFLELWENQASWQRYFNRQVTPVEVAEMIVSELSEQAQQCVTLPLRDWVNQLKVKLITLSPGPLVIPDIPNSRWWVSLGQVGEYGEGSWLDLKANDLEVKRTTRLIGIIGSVMIQNAERMSVATDDEDGVEMSLPYAPPADEEEETEVHKYPYYRGEGKIGGAMACYQMLAKYFGMPLRRDMLRRVLETQSRHGGEISLELAGALAQMVGLDSQLIKVPKHLLGRVEAPALVRWQGKLVVLFSISLYEIVLGVPDQGILRRKPKELLSTWTNDEYIEVLKIKKAPHTPQERFGLSWFWPYLWRYRKVLFEVLIASFFVQILSLANPLMIQVIIDKVLVQNSTETLNVLGILLLGIALAESVLSAIRTYLFVDTTNRIDMALGSEVIDHLLRLPLRYYERRPVGELSTRINELEQIRQFLTGTALTVVLDAIFSIIYIVVMFIYSWLLTLIALATVPLFALLTVLAAPLIRRQLRAKAERNAETQSYFVEVLSGIQTVKAQNLELTSRWQWQSRYARYIGTGFRTVITATAASSMSYFLNHLSDLLLLWIGALLVLKGELTLGQLIAFRVIAKYTTSPLLRLVQLWQNFQETALSLERLADIVDTPQEADIHDYKNIPMPPIVGAIRFEGVNFRFNPNSPLQLVNISLEIEPGSFVGIVGQSGAGKSTLAKLIARLYTPESGRIYIDNYDIAKVNLYSLRRQIGMVLQEPLLFDGTVQENIAQGNPDTPIESIIEAAKIACAHDFIMDLPQGYNTRVGQRGSALSGGQRQRIALARVLVQQPRLLILDEATSALDYNTEFQVCRNLSRAFRGKTVLFITHRLSTVREADRIILMDQGKIVEDGTHEELLKLKGRYYSLYQKQG